MSNIFVHNLQFLRFTSRLRIMEGHSARVASLAWNSYVVTSGCRSGQIIHHDVRQRDHIVSTINAHSQEVCGLKVCCY